MIGARKLGSVGAALMLAFTLSLGCEASDDDDDGMLNSSKGTAPDRQIDACIAEYDKCTAPANAQYAQCLASGAGWIPCGAALDTAVTPCALAIEVCLNAGK